MKRQPLAGRLTRIALVIPALLALLFVSAPFGDPGPQRTSVLTIVE